eukprot:TRINITY_DN627_c0_g2_i10.p1 TRINITY_DN627_c0_g2~~TRINITY_DN627_c0_g2_i10.p1  ORF type:complete len:105 (-),score=12.75 TRINITY_DN627_c0_g2_i10:103-417(-)
MSLANLQRLRPWESTVMEQHCVQQEEIMKEESGVCEHMSLWFKIHALCWICVDFLHNLGCGVWSVECGVWSVECAVCGLLQLHGMCDEEGGDSCSVNVFLPDIF